MKAKWTMVLILAFALLFVPGASYASEVVPTMTAEQAYDAGYSKGAEFYSEDPSFEDEDDALDAYITSDIFDKDQYDEVRLAGRLNDFEDGFVDGYEDAKKGDVKTDYADTIGKSMGSTAALNDFYEGNDSDWTAALPSERTISRAFNLDRMSDDYEDLFLKAFKLGFKEGYETAYEKALLEPPKTSMSQGLADGQAAGKILGELNAQKDYLLKSKMDYERDIPNERDIIDKYRLRLGTAEYSDAFVEGFRSAYEINYNVAFRKASQTEAVIKTKGIQIGAAGGVLTVDQNFGVAIDKGTFYMPVYLRIDTMNTSFFKQGPMIRASEIYQVNLDNPAGTLDKTKTIAVSFPYYGDMYKAGIYKLVDEKWYYMPSKVEGDYITAYVSPETLTGRDSVFAVFMDESIRLLTDVRDHWAKDEIETMVRRGIILGYPGTTALDGTFRPGQGITRAEFLILLSRIESWILPNYVASAAYFTDYQTFSTYDRIISYGLNNSYILGYTDRTFRPHNPISYYEVELIMGRVLRDTSFRWNSVATQMMYDKAFKSPGFMDLNRKITRAEVAYMLYTLNEWRY